MRPSQRSRVLGPPCWLVLALVASCASLAVLPALAQRPQARPQPFDQRGVDSQQEPDAPPPLDSRDDFNDRASLSWTIMGHNPDQLSYERRPGHLTILTQPGDPQEEPVPAKNLHLVPAQLNPQQEFEVSTALVEFAPLAPGQRAGLMLYTDESNFAEWTVGRSRRVGERLALRLKIQAGGREIRADEVVLPENPKRIGLRVTRRLGRFIFLADFDGKGFVPQLSFPFINFEPQWYGLFATSGLRPDARSIPAAFDYFAISEPTEFRVPDPATYYAITARDMTILERGFVVEPGENENQSPHQGMASQLDQPRVRLISPQPAEAHAIEDLLGLSPQQELSDIDRFTIVVRSLDPPTDVEGELLLRDRAHGATLRIRFKAPAELASPRHRTTFHTVQMRRYQQLASRNLPGQAWFRYQAARAEAAIDGTLPQFINSFPAPAEDTDMLDTTYALFSGGRAVSENLALDRPLTPGATDERRWRTRPVDSLEGITIAAIDWKPLLPAKPPQFDELAKLVPHDQHLVIFPSFQSAMFVADRVREEGAWLLTATQVQSQSYGVMEFYQAQLGLSFDSVSRLVGDQLTKSVALTGSDPYYRTGTDVAVLLESTQPAILHDTLLAQVTAAARNQQVQLQADEHQGVTYRGGQNATRTFSSYIARLGSAIVVSNSPQQLRRIIDVHAGYGKSLTSLDEYSFFRHRYPVGDPAETGFIFLSDDTIRRWCSPRWRIATARRTRDAAVLADLTARMIDNRLPDVDDSNSSSSSNSFSQPGDLRVEGDTIHHDRIGNLRFLTPIIELDTERITEDEARAYERWRMMYQNQWRWAFDPIAMRVTWTPRLVGADLTVMPLVARTDYQPLIDVSRGAVLDPDDGDPHGAPFHLVLALNKQSDRLRGMSSPLRLWSLEAPFEPLSWLDKSVAVYLDDDPVWQELAKLSADQLSEQWNEFGPRIPIAIRADVSDGLRLSAFLLAARGWIDRTVPGMLTWEAVQHNDTFYTQIRPTDQAVGEQQFLRNFALYYYASGRSLTISLNPSVIERAIDRELARIAAEAPGSESEKEGKQEVPGTAEPQRDWLGSNLAVHASPMWLQMWHQIQRAELQGRMQREAWRNLPILNEWHQKFPESDPSAIQQRYWHQLPLCPGGGQYVWNEEWQTMESTVYGHPGAPKEGPGLPLRLRDIRVGDFGLTFEPQGLRARFELTAGTE